MDRSLFAGTSLNIERISSRISNAKRQGKRQGFWGLIPAATELRPCFAPPSYKKRPANHPRYWNIRLFWIELSSRWKPAEIKKKEVHMISKTFSTTLLLLALSVFATLPACSHKHGSKPGCENCEKKHDCGGKEHKHEHKDGEHKHEGCKGGCKSE